MAATKYSEAMLVNKMTDLIKLANINLNHFPRHEKYGLSQQIRNTMYDVYNLIIEGEKRHHKTTSLVSIVGNAKRTATYAYFMLQLKTKGVQL